MKFNVTIDGLDKAELLMQGFSERRINSALATAFTRTAVAARTAAQAALYRDLDRPTEFTAKRLLYVPAKAERPEAMVGFDIAAIRNERGQVMRYAVLGAGETSASRYLQFQVYGGERRVKRFEKALQASGAMPAGWHSVPARGAKLDAHGNMQHGQLVQILSQVGTELTAGHNRTLPRLTKGMDKQRARQVKNLRRRSFGKAGGQYVAVPVARGKLKPGIYLAEGRNFGAKWGYGRTGSLVPVLIFVRTTSYRPRFDFYGAVSAVVNDRLRPEVARSIAEHIARLRQGEITP